MLREGRGKHEIQAETGNVIGLDRVSLSVEPGEIFVVMGLSGSGKSTLIRHVNRLIDPTAGEIVVNGVDVMAHGCRGPAGRTGAIPSRWCSRRFGLLPHRSVLGNVAFGLEVRGVAREERNAARPALDRERRAGRLRDVPARASSRVASSSASAWPGRWRWIRRSC